MRVRPSEVKVGLGVALAMTMGLLAGCSVDAESNTGIRVNVTYHESVAAAATDGIIDHLRFYVAVQYNDSDLWVLHSAGAGIEVDVTGQDLLADPYQLLVARKDDSMRAIRVVVVGERNGAGVLYGQLADPTAQAFQPGSILQRTIALRLPATSFDMSWTQAGCLTSSSMRNELYDTFVFVNPNDLDCDTYTSDVDCDDLNSEVHPGFEEGYECDGVDNNCDGIIDPNGHLDFDGDGFSSCAGDCNDEVYEINPDALEVCDGLDNNCNGKCDDAPDFDHDQDGYTTCGSFINHDTGTCSPVPPDCNDNNADVNPGAEELCNGVDDNCNEECDETWDPDGDGYTECGSTDPSLDFECTEPNPELEDCEPWDPTVNPGVEERCDGYDSNCDGELYSDTDNCYALGAQEGDCQLGTMSCIENGGGETWGACGTGDGELMPLDRCGIWHHCVETPYPGACMDLSIHNDDELVCHLGFNGSYEAGACISAGGRPTYPLPFGFTGQQNCTWHLLLWDASLNYQEVGLVVPNAVAQPASMVLHSCEAALVALPYTGDVNSPGPIEGILSFYYDNGPSDFYAMEMDFSINPILTCAEGALSCNVVTSP